MGWDRSIFQLLIVASGTGFSGLFVYSPAPGPGNLVASISASSGTDPYGNNYDAGISSYSGLSTAILNASSLTFFAGITERATISPSHFTVFNSHGATIFDVDLALSAQFLYADTGSATQGALLVSQSQANGVDQFGNHFVGLGVAVYTTSTALQFAGSLGIQAYTGSLAAGWTAGAANIFPANSAAEYAVTGPLVLVEETSPGASIIGPRVFGSSASGMLEYVSDSTKGDSDLYVTGHAVTPNTSAVSLVQTGFTNIFGGRTVAATNYLVQAHLIVTIGGTGTALTFQLTGPAVGANTSVKWWLTIESGTGQSMFAGHSLGSLASVTLPSGTTVGAGGVCHIWMSAYLQFTSSGTLNLQGETSVALSGATVAIGSTLEVFPAS